VWRRNSDKPDGKKRAPSPEVGRRGRKLRREQKPRNKRQLDCFADRKLKKQMKVKLNSAKAALLIIAYNCFVVPVVAFILVLVWRIIVGSVYGYAKYEPITPVIFLLLAAVVAEIILAANLADVKNVRGMLIGFGISLLLSPVVLLAIWLSIMLGNR
jgi:hypothetical protein